MDGIEIRSRLKEPESGQKRPVAPLLFLTAGVIGVLSFLHALAGVTFPGWAAYSAALVSCSAIWYTYYGRRKIFLLLVFILSAGCGIILIAMWDTISAQAGHIVGFLAGNVREAMPITETAVFLAVLLSLFMSILELLLKNHILLFLLTMLMLLCSPVIGVRTGVVSMLLLVLYQVAFLVMQATMSSGYAGHAAYQVSFLGVVQEVFFPGHGRVAFGGVEKHRLAGRSSLAASVVIMVFSLVLLPIEAGYKEKLYDAAFDIEGDVLRVLRISSGMADRLVTGGRVSTGNNYPVGTKHLSVSASSKPGQTLYLRGFAGGLYIGGDWTPADDEALFGNIMEKMGWQEEISTIELRYNSMYYMMNSHMRSGGSSGSVTLTIKHYGRGTDELYTPYYSQRSRIYEYDERDDFFEDKGYGDGVSGYVYRYYGQQDMHIDWENVITNFYTMRDWYKEMQTAYMEEIQTAYTFVPTEILPRLTRLCRENPMGDLEEITAFILYTLHSNASYTLTPGWAPRNKDIVEYFLFESGMGYCEHFAAAATLMYRMYGIPARYATGYMVSPEDFALTEDDTWEATVTDENAHAWVEIFLEDYGWTPVEMTPALTGDSVASYPGFDSELLGRIMQEHGWDKETSSLSAYTEDGWGESWQERGFSFGFQIDFARYGKIFIVLGTCFVYSLCLLPFFLDYRRLRILKKINRAGCRRIYFRLQEMLSFMGYLPGYDGTEEDFAVRLAEQMPSVAMEDIARLQEIVSEAAYGEGPLAPEKEEQVRNLYTQMAMAAYGTLKWYKKLVFRYWKAFI